MKKSAFYVPVMAAVITFSSLTLCRAGETVERTKSTREAKTQRTTAAAPTEHYVFAKEVYYTPTGSHIPERVHKYGYITDSRLPLTVLTRDDLDRLSGSSTAVSALSQLPSVYIRGR